MFRLRGSRPYLNRSIAGIVLALAIAAAPANTHANWLTRLGGAASHVGEAGIAKTGRLGLGAGEHAAAFVSKLPANATKATSLAAHATPEGHWKFANREGQVFTAGTPDELARVSQVLAPDAQGEKLALYLSEDTVFKQRTLIKDLPADAELHVVAGNASYPLHRPTSATGLFTAEIRPNVMADLLEPRAFAETLFLLGRPLNRSNIRVLALDPAGARPLSTAPRFDSATKTALVDQVDPSTIGEALRAIKGQTVLITGRIEGDTLTYLPASGVEQNLFIRELIASAEAADVNVVLVNAAASRQPGGRNWLWQRVSVAGLDEAMSRATFADFLSSLGGKSGKLAVSMSEINNGRVALQAIPQAQGAVPLSGALDGWMAELTGHVVTRSLHVFAREQEREEELDARLIPGIPSSLQYLYLGSLVLGLFALPLAFQWWRRLWPEEQRAEYSSVLGFIAARAFRGVIFFLLFLPIVALPAVFVSAGMQIWVMLTAPFRALAWLRTKLLTRNG